MTSPVAVRVVCGRCPTIVGRVVVSPEGGRYMMPAPAGPSFIIGGFEPLRQHVKDLKAKGYRGPGPERELDLPIDVADEWDYGDQFPTFCGQHGDGQVHREALVTKFVEYETTGIRTEVVLTR
jgi:hypothetical protein